MGKLISAIFLLNAIFVIALALTEEEEYQMLVQQMATEGADVPQDVVETASLAAAEHPTEEVTYGYDENSQYPPYLWSEKWPTCKGLRQSPINLTPATCKLDYSRHPLKLNRFYTVPTTTTITNLGHTVQFSFTFGQYGPTVTRGILNKKTYLFAQAHFHFGRTDDIGSEHTIDSKSASLEQHLVFYKAEYGDVMTASEHSDGLIVVATLFQATDNVANKIYTENLGQVLQPGDSFTLNGAKGYSLLNFIETQNVKHIRYSGSLTTPPCSESVTWYISTSVRPISHADLAAFRALSGEHGEPMAGDTRPTQLTNGRVCYMR
uniref:carbonic anhydrase n=1 Tax=Lutzomyia longipalpis TaxID=7200 RepID=A0A1B0GHY4_LUTLO